MKKKILVYANYFYPECASTAQLLTELFGELTKTFEVIVICTIPCYTGTIDEEYKTEKYYYEEYNSIKIIRIRVPEFNKENKKSRIKNIVGYFLGAIRVTTKVGKIDYVFSISQPPILGGLLGVWGKWTKHAKFIYNIQDFNPEQTVAVNYSKNKFILKVMMLLDKFSCKQSDLVITVGRDLVETLQKRFKNKNVPNCVMINNWIDEKEIYPLSIDNENVKAFKEEHDLQDKFVIMYSGNIGLYYDLENLIKVIEKFKNSRTKDGKKVVFAFIGAGSVLNKLIQYKEEKGLDNVQFIPYQDKENLIYSLNAGDVHFCVNAKGIKGVSCPSKYYGIAACAKPVIGILESGAEIRCIIDETESGLCAEPGDYEKIEENIKWFIDNAENSELKEMGERGHQYLLKNLTKDISINKYRQEILKL